MIRNSPVNIVVVLDRSGSMSTVRNDTIGGFNEFISAQKREARKHRYTVTVTLVQFDDKYEVVYSNRPIGQVPPLTQETFVPRGGTALYDAIGRTVNDSGVISCNTCRCGKSHAMARTLFVVLTDGEENSSYEYTAARVASLIRSANENNCEFVFIGANQDAILSARKMGINPNSALTYAANAVGTQNAFRSLNRVTSDFTAAIPAAFNVADRRIQSDAGA